MLRVGKSIGEWTVPRRPTLFRLAGQYCLLERLDARRHAEELYKFNATDKANRIWTYLPYGPFLLMDDYQYWVQKVSWQDDPYFWAIFSYDANCFCGVASWLRIYPERGSIEVGHINYSPLLQRTRAGTEAMFIMLRWAFQNGYRRYEWKCDALNLASMRAAERLGLSFEGIFRQATICKGRNRDTAWFAAVDSEWPQLQEAFEAWLSPDNFDEHGIEKRSLRSLTQSILVKRFADEVPA